MDLTRQQAFRYLQRQSAAAQEAAAQDSTALTGSAQDSSAVAGSIQDGGGAETLLPNPFDTAFQEQFLHVDLWIGAAQGAVRIVIILFLAWFLIRIFSRATDRWTKRFDELPLIHPRRQRAFLIKSLLLSSVRYVIWPLAFITVLGQLNIDVAALVATAGIAGIAIGFGAQSLVKDVISGVLLLFDDSIHVGDLVRIGQEEGIVEYIGVRLIKVRRFNGEMLMIPAGELRTFGNRSIDFARVIVNVGLSYGDDHDRVMAVMERVALTWADRHRDIIKEENPLVHGITDFAESSVNVRVVVMVVPGEQWEAERELRRDIKTAFDEEGIEIPFPQRTLHIKNPDAGTDVGQPGSEAPSR